MNRGFIGLLILIIIALAALKYFLDWSIFDAADSEQGRNTIEYIKNILNISWSYIRIPIFFIWEKILEFRQSS
ncbi:MAG: hypothetical protein UT07_C0010G0015 [Parcubacteria group bacterium GW2011_GWB1_38_8]|uniref:Uncharacterized protein n=1 Tax=Candidatus Zambryskibacteria bacterium RIFCSPLOWO2_02_FULL_39_14 TaxID=1802769 RepID=A0A1G2UEZ0_9BACT|nr:MAG: hypothetical protein UT07_C0010G0015 [Parcubacteria group bacterium GW2011_GWB1_38_8]KKR31048.1 MAG: hypothetical protein UT62_C0001G0040 [Parcubacteria group bacterium GW2011_GWC1_39_8]OHA94303.1 MAG: hypothetical protein A3C62_00565 [Candidatus Zambryskibacteria bacterium RIFCSPHIGHO2_02_FULL_39_16]OHB08013.1 MAG: hypothetical protein A3I86_01385 [Candidatus Zambryskibacteria bacterium RIFCSPLOWO2_02_FULL_39_14]